MEKIGGKAKPLKQKKKVQSEMDDEDKAFLERKKKEAQELKVMAEKAKQKGPLVRLHLHLRHSV